MDSESLSLPSRPLLTKAFRFLDLPGEIRDKIYAIILCSVEARKPTSTEAYESNPSGATEEFHETPSKLTHLRHNIEPQILRTSRSIYSEANYVMRRTNLFIKIIVHIPFEEISQLLILKKIPILKIDRNKIKKFKCFVMSHEITSPVPQKGVAFLILYRDLDVFCKGLTDYKYLITRDDDIVSHIVTLVDPCESKSLPNSPIFYSRKLQEMLIAPYRTLRGFPRFQIKGDIPQDLSRAAIAEITQSPAADPDAFLLELEELKAKGNEFFRVGNGTMASESWAQALMKIFRLMMSKEGRQMRETGGEEFINRISALKFDLNSNRAQNAIKAMRDNASDQDLVQQLGGNFEHAIGEAGSAQLPGSTWEPSARQLGKLFYRKAVGYRLLREFNQATIAIDAAIRQIPDDTELGREKERIIQQRRCY
jgi:hypothetical protein